MERKKGEFCARLKQELSFHYLSPEDSAAIAVYLDCRQAAAGESLWREGDECSHMLFVVNGRLEAAKQTEFPGKEVIVGLFGPGSVVGELCLLQGRPRILSVTAMEQSDLLFLTRESFDRLLQEDPFLGLRLLKGMLLTVSSQLGQSYERLASIF